jgi:hypothetical protein
MVLKVRNGFLVIEVIISIFITFLAIVTITTAYKYKNIFDNKNDLYQDLYITTKSIISLLDKEKININNLKFVKYKTLQLNGFNIDIFIKKTFSKRNYVKSFDQGISGNNGNLLYNFYTCKVVLRKNNFKKEIMLFLTKVKKS